MREINRYIQNQRNQINTLKQQPLVGFTNQRGEHATWDDPAVSFTFPDGQYVHFYFTNQLVKLNNYNHPFTPTQTLPEEFRSLLMLYAIDLCAKNYALSTISQKHFYARKVINEFRTNPANITEAQLTEAFPKIHSHIIEFIEWLHSHEFIPPALNVPTRRKITTPSGDDIIENKKNHLPEEQALLALGAIFHDVISPDETKWNLHPKAPQRDAFVCAMVALGMGAANRIGAEQTVLEKQRLSSIRQVVNGKEEIVHYLNWPGSKGHKDYQNHIVSIMSEKVDLALKYIEKVCEPGRVLVRFYENPNLPLTAILEDFCPSRDKLEVLSPDMNEPINLIQLGYLLGFYDCGDGMVRVSESTNGASVSTDRGYYKYFKRIAELKLEDEILLKVGCKHTHYLLGTSIKYPTINKIFTRDTVTVRQFQELLVDYFVSHTPGFPVGFNRTKKGKCKYKHALFCFLGSQLFTKINPPFAIGKSHFAIVSLSSLNNIFIHEVASKKNSIKTKGCTNIFMRHGFSLEFSINPHQLRHWLNDVAEREGIPHALINLWSGRKGPEQILSYVYRTHKERGSEIADIMYSDTSQEITVKVASKEEYEKLAGIAATETSVGFCTQSLAFSPCDYQNDFVTQCTLCPSTCYVAHDQEALAFLRKDLDVQIRRLEDVASRPNFHVSQGGQDWFVVHHRNTSMLAELIKIMERDDIKPGSIIRLLANKNEYRVTNLEAKKVVIIEKLSLPDSFNALARALESKEVDQDDDHLLGDLLALI